MKADATQQLLPEISIKLRRNDMWFGNSSDLNPNESLGEIDVYRVERFVGSMFMTAAERYPDSTTAAERYQACVFYADALLCAKGAKRAEAAYMKSLALYKEAKNGKISPLAMPVKNGAKNLTPEAEVKYKLHVCLLKQAKFKEALGVLESIPKELRSPKISVALGQAYKRLNLNQAAKQAFKDLLAVCPYALESVVEYLNCECQEDDDSAEFLTNLTSSLSSSIGQTFGRDWLSLWLDGHKCFASRDYQAAAKFFDQLDTSTFLANNPMILCNAALSAYYAGEYSAASSFLLRVHTLDPLHVECMDILAGVLAHERRVKELESLATRMMSNAPECRQSWVCMGYLARALKKPAKALYFAHKACGDSKPKPYAEAMILKGQLLMDMKKLAEATLHFQEALQYNLYRYELYEGLVNCLLERQKLKEARSVGALCLKQTGQTARAMTLYATVLAKDASTLSEAQLLLEKSVRTAPYLLNAVYLLVNIYDRTKQYEKAIDLLKRQTSICVNSKLHGMLGEILGKSSLHSQAMDSYRLALTLDPQDDAALAGLSDLSSTITSASTSAAAAVTPAAAATAASSNVTPAAAAVDDAGLLPPPVLVARARRPAAAVGEVAPSTTTTTLVSLLDADEGGSSLDGDDVTME